MAKGDHLYVSRGTYTHHGIDCGDGTVIHYREGEAITRSTGPYFALGETIYVKPYGVSDPPDVVVRRAESRLGERDYNLVFNNCEHFSTWCKTGEHRSEQVDTVVAASLAGGVVGGVLLGGVFAAPALAAAGVYGVSKLMEQAQSAKDPQLAQQYMQSAIAQLRTTYQEQQDELDRLQAELDTWDRTARLALNKNRDDLARAALAKKYPLKLKIRALEPRLQEISALLQQIQPQAMAQAMTQARAQPGEAEGLAAARVATLPPGSP